MGTASLVCCATLAAAQVPRPWEEPRLAPDAPPPASLSWPEAAISGTGDHRIDALWSGYNWPAGSTVTVSFYSDAVFAGSYYGSETVVREPSAAMKANVRAILAMSRTLFGLTLVEVAETTTRVGQVRIMLSNGPSFAYCYYPSSTAIMHVAGDCHFNPAYDRLGDTNGFQHGPGYHGYLTLIHELGHALGLKHPFTGSPTLPTAEDSTATTVMSYTLISPSPGQWQPYDRVALPWLYGPALWAPAAPRFPEVRP